MMNVQSLLILMFNSQQLMAVQVTHYTRNSAIHCVLYTTLVAPMDYGTVNVTLSFEACDFRRCTNVTIVNDQVLEGVESLDLTLERTTGLSTRITLLPTEGEIVITDDDGMF